MDALDQSVPGHAPPLNPPSGEGDGQPRIVALMQRLNWMQPRMAAYLGTSQATISRLANGQGETGPQSRVLDGLAREHGFADLVIAADPPSGKEG